MIQVIRSHERKGFDYGWLQTKHSFSFGSYYDPSNTHFGSLRVFNDDIVQPGQGFGTHPHQDFEIMTYVISGALEHRDSLGNKEVLHAGEVQRMSAGTGVTHSEYNHSQEEPVHFLQIWFFPNQQGLIPSWEQKGFPIDTNRNQLIAVVSGNEAEGALYIHQDVTVYVSKLDAGNRIGFEQAENRRIFLFVIEGELEMDDEVLQAGDSVRITELSHLNLISHRDSHFILMDLA